MSVKSNTTNKSYQSVEQTRDPHIVTITGWSTEDIGEVITVRFEGARYDYSRFDETRVGEISNGATFVLEY